MNMGPETVVGQLRPIMTDHYIKEKITKGASFAAAWEGLFGSLEYTAVMEQQRGTEITIDWQDGTESTHSAAEIWTIMFDSNQPCGTQANMAKLLAADASWEAANACLQFHGGYGFACEYDVERKFRETRLYQVAPISTNLILSYVAEHVLGLPRSF
jgi:alkylation response protein AidB-like acyl-CoA dehydrogenase